MKIYIYINVHIYIYDEEVTMLRLSGGKSVMTTSSGGRVS